MGKKKQQYDGKALVLDEQVNLLKARGVIVTNTPEAKQCLASVGFYRLFSYIKPFLNSSSAPPKFEQAWDLYIFDRKLRLLVIDAIERIEVAFRVSISEVMSTQYNPFWFSDTTHFANTKWHLDLMKQVIKLTDPMKHPLIKHYYTTYSYPEFPPSWMLIECLTFGSWSKTFHNLKDRKNKKTIAQQLGQSFKTLESWIVSLIEIRNICAHHERLWNHRFHFPPKDAPNEMHQLGKFYQQAYIIVELLKKISPSSDWKQKYRKLLEEHCNLPIPQMGFIHDWQNDPFWN